MTLAGCKNIRFDILLLRICYIRTNIVHQWNKYVVCLELDLIIKENMVISI